VAETILLRVDGQEVEVGPGDIIGRSRSAAVNVSRPVVSRKHAQLHRNSAGWFLSDLDSSNGLYGPRGESRTVLLPPGVNRFWLGPPHENCMIEAVVPGEPPVVDLTDSPPSQAVTRRLTDADDLPTTPLGPPEHGLPTTPLPPPEHGLPITPMVGPDGDDDLHPPGPDGTPGPVPERIAPRVGIGAMVAGQRLADPDTPHSHQRHSPGPRTTPRSAPLAGIRLSTDAAKRPQPRGVAVRAEGLTVIVDDELVILDEATLSIEGGTLTAIVGPSGCGKSTLANLLSGRSTPTKGTVTIDGQPMSASVRQRIGSVPQYDAVHERLTVRHALAAAARLRLAAGTSGSDIERAVTQTARVLGLDHRLDTRVGKLSGGQKKRVSVGYELVANPVMLVLDEPTSGLDPGLEQELIAELRAIADRGTTTIVVTHSPEAAQQADLVVVMAPGGHLAFVGPPGGVLDHFAALTWAEVFSRLTPSDGQDWAQYFATTPAHQRHVLTPPRITQGTAGPLAFAGTWGTGTAAARIGVGSITELPRSWWSDFRVMTGRYLRSIVADSKSLLLLAAQAPILGLLFAAVLSTRVFTVGLRPSTSAREFVLAAVLAMVWIGASNSIREIVKERVTFLRERAVGVTASSLVASRWAVLATVTVVQSVVLYYAAVSRQTTPPESGVLLGNGPAELILALVAVGLASVGIGLVISGAVTDAAKSMAALPLVLIPVILFSGLLIPTSGPLLLEALSWINPIHWGSSAAAVTANVLEKEGCNPTGLQAQLQQVFLGRTISCANPRWQTTVLTQAVNLGAAVISVGVLVWLSFVVTARSTRNLRT
jgi:ABC-type multidrug transport system ATPase subunit